MELICEKYKEKMKAEGAFCRHPGEYCKFRNACMIHFLSKESKRQPGQDETKGDKADEGKTASG